MSLESHMGVTQQIGMWTWSRWPAEVQFEHQNEEEIKVI